MVKKLQLSILCGGVSAEHEISILSARNVVKGLNPKNYEISVIYITHDGSWHLLNDHQKFLNQDPAQLVRAQQAQKITVNLGDSAQPWMQLDSPYQKYSADCVFPVLHGTMGEDGTMQGLLELLNVAYVGAGVLGSAVCMEKHIAKSLLRAAGLPTANWMSFEKHEISPNLYTKVAAQLGNILFVKPVGLGSSVGVTKVRNSMEFDSAIMTAFQYDDQILIESAVKGREIEVSVLGAEKPVASLPGEIILRHEFYSYAAKYLDPNGALVVTPAELSEAQIQQFQDISVRAFKTLQCSGMARVDFFLKEDGEILINELNTIPGFTDISMYPKNWEVSGLTYSDLLDSLIRFAMTHQQTKQKIARVRKNPHQTQDRGMAHSDAL